MVLKARSTVTSAVGISNPNTNHPTARKGLLHCPRKSHCTFDEDEKTKKKRKMKWNKTGQGKLGRNVSDSERIVT